MAKRNSPMKEIIKESLRDIRRDPKGEFEKDPELQEDGEISGPARFAKTQLKKDDIIIDRLLAPIAKHEGYFLKLKKEVRIGEWMLMKVIKNDWRKWADMESAVADIVKEHTRYAPQKWGTGNYRIEFACEGGVRGDNYDDRDFPINAEEEMTAINNPAGAGVILPAQPVVDPSTAVAGQIETLTNLVNMLKGVFPQAPDPTRIQEQVAGAFKDGMALKLSEGSNSNQMMTVLMTGMMQMMTALVTKGNEPRVVNPEDGFKGMLETLKTFGLVGQNPQQQKTTIDFVKELKELGMDLFKKDDPIQQIGQLKQLANIAGEFMGMGGSGDRPGIFEKVVDALTPVLPGMIRDVKETFGNAATAQIEAGRNIERARMTVQPAEGNTMNVGGNVNPPMTNPQIQMFFNGLYDAVLQNNRMFYPVIYTSLLQDTNGQQLLNGIVNGTHTAKEVIELLQQYGGDKYKDSEFVMKKLVGFTNGFIIWMRNMVKSQQETVNVSQPQEGAPERVVSTGAGTYDAECQLCHTIYAFQDEQDFKDEENKTCEVMKNGVLCPGILKPLLASAS